MRCLGSFVFGKNLGGNNFLVLFIRICASWIHIVPFLVVCTLDDVELDFDKIFVPLNMYIIDRTYRKGVRK